MHRGRGVRQCEERQQFAADSLTAEALERGRQRRAGGQPLGIGPAAEPRLEAEEPQYAQVVLADAGLRVADEANAAFGEVLEPPEEVGNLQGFGVDVERVDGEIAPRR